MSKGTWGKEKFLNILTFRELGEKLEQLKEKLKENVFDKQNKFDQYEQGYAQEQGEGLVICRFMSEGCQFNVPSMRGMLYRSK